MRSEQELARHICRTMMPNSPLHVTSPTTRAPRILIRTRQAAKGNATARTKQAAEGPKHLSIANDGSGSSSGDKRRGTGPVVQPSTAAAWAAWEDGVHCVRVSDRRGVVHKPWIYTLDRVANTLVGRSPQTASASAFVQQTTTSACVAYRSIVSTLCACILS